MGILKILDDQVPVFNKRLKVKRHLVVNNEIQEARRVKRRAENRYGKTRSKENKNSSAAAAWHAAAMGPS